jgi:hypothetical protein
MKASIHSRSVACVVFVGMATLGCAALRGPQPSAMLEDRMPAMTSRTLTSAGKPAPIATEPAPSREAKPGTMLEDLERSQRMPAQPLPQGPSPIPDEPRP